MGIEVGKDYEFELGKYRLNQDDLCASPEIFFTLPWVNGTDLSLHFFLDDNAVCRSGIIEWSMDSESDFLLLCEDSPLEKDYEIEYEDIDQMIEKLKPFADDLLTEFLLQETDKSK
jgi:hypothetical protein